MDPINFTPDPKLTETIRGGIDAHLQKANAKDALASAPRNAFASASPIPDGIVRMSDIPPMDSVLRIPGDDNLDPIIVYFEDVSPGCGRMTIACYADAWTACWGAMRDVPTFQPAYRHATVREFVADAHPQYLAGALLQLTGASARHRTYTERVAARVIAAAKESLRHGR